MDDNEQLIQARQLHVSAPVLLPLIEEREQNAYQKLLGEFRNSKSVDLATVAECNAYNSIKEDIIYKLQLLEHSSKEK